MSRPLPADPYSLANGLDRIRATGRFRTRRTLASAQGTLVRSEGRTFINFSSNDYLGLANDGRLVQALQARAAGLRSRQRRLAADLPGAAAPMNTWKKRSRSAWGVPGRCFSPAATWPTWPVITSFAPRRENVVVMDRDNHASLIDGALLARGRPAPLCAPWTWRDWKTCARALAPWWPRDGVFSMDGSIAALPDIAALCARRRVLLAVDDAHGFGVLGKTGGGNAGAFFPGPGAGAGADGHVRQGLRRHGGFRGRSGRGH